MRWCLHCPFSYSVCSTTIYVIVRQGGAPGTASSSIKKCIILLCCDRDCIEETGRKNMLSSTNNKCMYLSYTQGIVSPRPTTEPHASWEEATGQNLESWLKKSKPMYQYMKSISHQCSFRSLKLVWFHIHDKSNRSELIREAVFTPDRTVNTNVEAVNQPIGWISKTFEFNWSVYYAGKIVKPNQTNFFIYTNMLFLNFTLWASVWILLHACMLVGETAAGTYGFVCAAQPHNIARSLKSALSSQWKIILLRL